VTGTLDGHGQLTLMLGTSAGDTAGNNLGALAEVPAKAGNVFVVDIIYLIDTEGAYLFTALPAATPTLVSRIAVAVVSVSIICHG
jgi:hypothetical protein